MLTANLWQEVGLCNGAAGTVYNILYLANHHPPDLPIAVVVDFDTYTLESGLIKPMSFERLQAISKSHNFSTRLQEETRLQCLSLFASEL